jgi:hypothetical protein
MDINNNKKHWCPILHEYNVKNNQKINISHNMLNVYQKLKKYQEYNAFAKKIPVKICIPRQTSAYIPKFQK